jgi:hypothetical protein
MTQPIALKSHHHRSTHQHSHYLKSHPKRKEKAPHGQNPPNKPTPAVGPAIIEDNTTKPPTTMPAHIAVSLGYAATLHLWMFLYLLVQEEIIDGLVIGLEEGKRQGKNQAIL